MRLLREVRPTNAHYYCLACTQTRRSTQIQTDTQQTHAERERADLRSATLRQHGVDGHRGVFSILELQVQLHTQSGTHRPIFAHQQGSGHRPAACRRAAASNWRLCAQKTHRKHTVENQGKDTVAYSTPFSFAKVSLIFPNYSTSGSERNHKHSSTTPAKDKQRKRRAPLL